MAFRAVNMPTATGAVAGIPANGRYCGLVIRETAGTATQVRLWDNTAAASGTLIDVVSLPANGSASLYWGEAGVHLTAGLYLEKIGAGTIEGSIRIG